MIYMFIVFKQKTAYEMRISDWSSDVCSADLRAGHRMAEIGMAVLEKAAAVFEGVEDLLAQQSRADRLVAAAETLGDGHDVGGDALLLAGMQGAGAAHAAHHLVEDQQHAVCVADLADEIGRAHV